MRFAMVGRAAAMAAVGALALSACSGGSSSTSSSSLPTGGAVPSVSADPELAAMVPEAIKSKGTLTFGTDASYAPNEFLAEDGSTIIGFDIDLGNAIAAKLGLQSSWENATFDTLIVGVENGKYDASMSSFTITADREKQVNMISYFNAGTAWAVKTGNPSGISIDDACGKTVAVQKATVQVPDLEKRSKDCENSGSPKIDIQQYSLQSEATTAVVSGKADAMLADSPVVAYAIEQSGQMEQLGEIYDSAPYGVVVPKKETEFANAIADALNALIEDGTYEAIADDWGMSNGVLPIAEVNPSAS